MDSKLRRMTILSSMAFILLVAILVLYTNREEGTKQEAAYSQTEQNGEQEKTDTQQRGGQIGDDLSAFLKDNTFFDQENSSLRKSEEDESRSLSLMVTSV